MPRGMQPVTLIAITVAVILLYRGGHFDGFLMGISGNQTAGDVIVNPTPTDHGQLSGIAEGYDTHTQSTSIVDDIMPCIGGVCDGYDLGDPTIPWENYDYNESDTFTPDEEYSLDNLLDVDI